ncbi:hypothetical protein [Streptomyces sp. NPDC058955]|uniref:hypothetical protein n=1 Tax=unclassified Streptomyces TaxID=2593676 RepID=UPI0036568150
MKADDGHRSPQPSGERIRHASARRRPQELYGAEDDDGTRATGGHTRDPVPTPQNQCISTNTTAKATGGD